MRQLNRSMFWMGVAAIGAWTMTACSSDEPGGQTQAQLLKIELKTEQLPYVESTNQFATNLWDEINKSYEGSNFVVSPLSLQMCLSLMANGASGETLQELTSVLLPEFNGTASLDKLNELNLELLDKLPETDKNAKINLANSIWLGQYLTPIQAFVDRTSRYYGTSVFNFVPASESARNQINDWCSKATSGRITEMFKKAPQQDVLLLNALFFQHDWAIPFDASKTKKESFYCESGKTEKVDMMKDSYKGEVYVTDEAWMIRRPYGNSAFTMEFYKPMDGFTVAEAVSAGIGILYNRNINLELPKFALESDVDFMDILKNMGLDKALNEFADYSELTYESIVIKQIFQKTRIELDEKGTKVESVSIASGEATEAPPKNVYFKLDHPFGFVLRETSTNAIIAMGKIAEF